MVITKLRACTFVLIYIYIYKHTNYVVREYIAAGSTTQPSVNSVNNDARQQNSLYIQHSFAAYTSKPTTLGWTRINSTFLIPLHSGIHRLQHRHLCITTLPHAFQLTACIPL
ncbi:unnamed protein product [Ceratitis capitata]|uniref:(Mediterranean fruit fly) hypothetical protein n=1 Tax=Ceratitis capitata TaxID=7213 RepID=A0A811UNX9_CERCA|nr:unnamed protein product [Ceratitis capitata]